MLMMLPPSNICLILWGYSWISICSKGKLQLFQIYCSAIGSRSARSLIPRRRWRGPHCHPPGAMEGAGMGRHVSGDPGRHPWSRCRDHFETDYGVFQTTKKLFLSEQLGRKQIIAFARKNAANALSIANMVMGLSSILCSLNGQHHYACLLLLVGYLLDLTDGAVARHLNTCSPLGAKLDDYADFTSFGLATGLLLRADGFLEGLLVIVYVLAVFTRLCFFSSGIPFMYRGLPCPYASSVLACASILTGGNLVVMRTVAVVMILFMVDQGFWPHDKVLESQLWKKIVFFGGVLVLCFTYNLACLYYLAWTVSYIISPNTLWSCK